MNVAFENCHCSVRGRLWRKKLGQAKRTQFAAAHLRPQFLGDDGRVRAVADDLRPNEEDQFGAADRVVLRRYSAPQETGIWSRMGMPEWATF